MISQHLQISKSFSKVFFVLAGMNFQMYLSSSDASKFRKTMFNKQFLNQHFGLNHQAQLKQKIQALGYPDNGSGLYSRKASYRDWYKLNILQRIHLNYAQNISLATISVISAGLYNPNMAAGIGLTYILGRFLYSFFYKQQKGARNTGRIIGIAVCHIATAVGFIFYLANLMK